MSSSEKGIVLEPVLCDEIVNIKFAWLDELENPQPHAQFEGFIFNDVEVHCGQFIHIGLDGVDYPELGVVQLLSCYDTGSNSDNWRCRVQWYTHFGYIPDRCQKQLPPGAAPVDPTREIVLDKRKFTNDLDLETFAGICYVTECPIEMEPKSVVPPPEARNKHHYVCRFALQCKPGCRTPILTPLPQFCEPPMTPLTVYSPGKENIPPDSEMSTSKSGHKRPADEAARCEKKTRLSIAATSSAHRSAEHARRSLENDLNSVSAEALGESCVPRDKRSNSITRTPVTKKKKKVDSSESDDTDSQDSEENDKGKKDNKKESSSRRRNGKLELASIDSANSNSEASYSLRTPTKQNQSHHLSCINSPSVRGRAAKGTPKSGAKTEARGTPQRALKSSSSTPQRGVKSTPGTPQRGVKSTPGTPQRGVKSTPGTPQRGVKSTPGTPRRGVKSTPGTPKHGTKLSADISKKSGKCPETHARRNSSSVHRLPRLPEGHVDCLFEPDMSEESSGETPSPLKLRKPSLRASVGGRSTGHVCRECGEQFSSKQKLAEHRDKDACAQASPTASPATPKASTAKNSRARTNETVSTPPKRVDEVISSLRGRNSSAATASSSLERAKARLHVSAVPDSLPCREDECQQLYDYIESKLNDRTGGCMYISGVPGTGKTATVREVVRLLRSGVDSGDVPDFIYVEVNALKLSEPKQVWVKIWEEFTGQAKVTPDHAAALLEKHFKSPKSKSPPLLLLVDELDLLWTKKQDVLYRLFEWPSLAGSRLLVVTIANTMDLPERVLMARVSSRLGLTRTTFHPYTHHQLQVIVQSRLEGIPGFESDAIQLVARKVAAVCGDARRALDICRRAAEISEVDHGSSDSSPSKKTSSGVVGLKHVNLALTEMFTSPKIMAIRECSAVEQQVLAAVVAEYQRTGVEETSLERLYAQFLSLCAFDGKLKHISLSNVIVTVNRLSARRLLITESARRHLAQRISLNISVQDVKFALDCVKQTKI